MCNSCTKKFTKVTLAVCDGIGDDYSNKNISIIDFGKPYNRVVRVFLFPFRLLSFSLKYEYCIYHLHDPELLIIGLLLIIKGKNVVYDFHEDFPKQVLSKHYLSHFTRIFISKSFKLLECTFTPLYSGIITATPSIRQNFYRYNKNTIDIRNYPILIDNNNCIKFSLRTNIIID